MSIGSRPPPGPRTGCPFPAEPLEVLRREVPLLKKKKKTDLKPFIKS